MADFSISQENQKELLLLARKAIALYLNKHEVMDFSIDKNDELMRPAAVFVTLTQNGALRGCIGTIEPQYPLFEAVIRMAISAALNDSRFFPLEAGELPETKIEISVLSPMVKVKNPDDIVAGKHGVLVQKGARSGLFLPQVWEHFRGTNKKTQFLNELCSQKAGLPQNAWQDPAAELFVFTVFSFED